MKFKNETKNDIMIQRSTGYRECYWDSLKLGEIVDIPEVNGKRLGLTPVEKVELKSEVLTPESEPEPVVESEPVKITKGKKKK